MLIQKNQRKELFSLDLLVPWKEQDHPSLYKVIYPLCSKARR